MIIILYLSPRPIINGLFWVILGSGDWSRGNRGFPHVTCPSKGGIIETREDARAPGPALDRQVERENGTRRDMEGFTGPHLEPSRPVLHKY
jgi:hypothetical protein